MSDVDLVARAAAAAARAIADAAVPETRTVNSKLLTGNIVISAGDVGLGNCNNTSDMDKPVSTAQAASIAGKANSTHTHATSEITNLDTSLAGKASTTHATEHEPGGSDEMAVDAVAATGSLRTLGTSATSACAGNDSRLVDTTKMKFSAEGGLMVKLTNRTGGSTTKGYLVSASSSYTDAFTYTALDIPDPIGVVYEASVADGAECWVVVSGIAEVYFYSNTTRGYFARMGKTADGGAAGQAIAEAVPGTPFATDKHFMEIGHVLQAITGPGLARCVLHFN